MHCCIELPLLHYEEDDDCSCQFEHISEELITVDGKAYCKFHCPVSDKDGSRTEKGLWNEDQIEQFNKSIFKILNLQSSEKKKSISDSHICDLRAVVFPGDFQLSDIEIDETISFNGCQFHGDLEAMDATFLHVAEFCNVTFFGEATFYNTHFSTNVMMSGSLFKGRFDLSCSRSTTKDFDQMRIVDNLDMDGCKFLSDVTMQNREFSSLTSFTDCVFDKAPRFDGCQIHQNTYFPPIRSFKDVKTKDAYKAYRVLKLSMENVRNRVDEAAFFALEQRALRNRLTFHRNYLSFSFLYDLTSEYGYNALRPLLLLVLFNLMFFYLYLNIGQDVLQESSLENVATIEKAFDFTVLQVTKPFSVWDVKFQDKLEVIYKIKINTAVKLATMVHSVTSYILVTLFLLAIRWRFKRG